MSESPFAFQDEQSVDLTADEPAGDSKRNLVAVVALAVVALGAGAWFLLGGGGEEPTEEVAFAPVKRAPRVEAPVAPPAPALPEASTTQLGTNPFKALIVKPVDNPAPAAAPTPAAAPAMPVIIVSTGAAGAPITVATQPAPAPAPVPVISTVKFTAVSGSKPVGTFVLDGKTYPAAKGENFGGKVRVMDLRKNLDGAWLAVLQVGDGSPFEIYENQELVIP